jgi:hypothetical protein
MEYHTGRFWWWWVLLDTEYKLFVSSSKEVKIVNIDQSQFIL